MITQPILTQFVKPMSSRRELLITEVGTPASDTAVPSNP